MSRKKDEAERKERELQEKLEIHRQQMEYRLGIKIGPAPAVTPKVPISRNATSGRKRPARASKKRKGGTTDINTNTEDSGDVAPKSKRRETGDVSRGTGDSSTGSTEVEEMDLEHEFNDAFEELFDDCI
jgi:hypothetical protein